MLQFSLKTAFAIMFAGWLPYSAFSQTADDVFRYNLQYPGGDARTMVLPGTSHATGFGAYKDNPASMALFEESFFSLGLSHRSITEESSYLGSSSSFSNSQGGVGNLGMLFKFPVVTGSFVMGAGYSQTSDFNRGLKVSGHNSVSTITDFYNITPDDSLYFAAFDVYAIDGTTGDSTESIFRLGLPEYPGIYQSMELTERGSMGEFSGFVATEFRRNFYVGVSFGLMTGSYSYHRDFLESDRDGDYDFDFIDTDNDGTGDTDIDNILSVDEIDADFTAFILRAGFVYRVMPGFRVGVSYQPPSRLHFDETYNTTLTTTFDNGVQFEDDAPGRFSYMIQRPSRWKAGVSVSRPAGFLLSVSAEAVPYSSSRIEFEDIRLEAGEEAINEVVRSGLNDVINTRIGVQYTIDNRLTPRLGYAYFPSPQKETDATRHFLSGGISAEATEGVMLDLGIQYSMWEDRNRLYYYQESGTGSRNYETAQESIGRWHVMGGVRVLF